MFITTVLFLKSQSLAFKFKFKFLLFNTVFLRNIDKHTLQECRNKKKEKSEVINLQMLIHGETVKKRAKQCLPRFLWRGRHFGTCESMRSSPVLVPGIP